MTEERYKHLNVLGNPTIWDKQEDKKYIQYDEETTDDLVDLLNKQEEEIEYWKRTADYFLWILSFTDKKRAKGLKEVFFDEKKEVKLNEKISEKERFTPWGNRIKDNGKFLNVEFKDKYDAKAFCKFLNYLNKEKQWAVDEVNELCMWHKEHYGKSILDERMGW